MQKPTNNIVTRGDGVQDKLADVIPVPFNFALEVMHQGGFDSKAVRVLADLSLREMFPDAKGNLFKWDELTPHEAVSMVAAYYAIDESLNSGAVKSNRPIKNVKDSDIDKRLRRPGGVMSPREVERRFSPSAYRGQVKM